MNSAPINAAARGSVCGVLESIPYLLAYRFIIVCQVELMNWNIPDAEDVLARAEGLYDDSMPAKVAKISGSTPAIFAAWVKRSRTALNPDPCGLGSLLISPPEPLDR